MRREVGAFLVAVITLLSTLSTTQYTTPSFVTTPEGVPILETVFADFAKSEPDPVMLPQSPVIKTNSSITMKIDLNESEMVNESVAVNASLDFIRHIWYLSDHNFSIESGWTILERESWRVRFIDESEGGYVHVGVNAFSGKVDAFSCGWEPDETNNTTPSTSELEQVVIDFLSEFNYTLSLHARYVGPTLFNSHAFNKDAYVLIFYNAVNGTRIDSGVYFSLDVGANAVQQFSYSWVHIDSLPTESIISTERAGIEVSDYLINRFDESVFEIQSFTLLFDRTWTQTSYTWRLCWYVSINYNYIDSVYIDAISGRPYNYEPQMGAPSHLLHNMISLPCISSNLLLLS